MQCNAYISTGTIICSSGFVWSVGVQTTAWGWLSVAWNRLLDLLKTKRNNETK